jgi:hypothetical protein
MKPKKLNKYSVFFTFGAAVLVDAENEEQAEEIVDEMSTDELLYCAKEGFEICNVEKIEG